LSVLALLREADGSSEEMGDDGKMFIVYFLIKIQIKTNYQYINEIQKRYLYRGNRMTRKRLL
jgi:hypothetical protein